MADKRDPDEEHRAVFGEEYAMDEDDSGYDSDECWEHRAKHRGKFGFDLRLTNTINRLKNNDPTLKKLSRYDNLMGINKFTDLAWKLLGRYVGENTNISYIALPYLGLTDEKMSILFKELTKSSSLTEMELSYNYFGSDGIRSMTPFLTNAPNLTSLRLDNKDNTKFDLESFELLISALDGGPLEKLVWECCEMIKDITALGRFFLPHLKELSLGSNSIRSIPSLQKYIHLEELDLSYNEHIGADGCRAIAKLLENKSSSLRKLNLTMNKVGDEEAEILAQSLQHNITLQTLEMENVQEYNSFREAGCKAFLKLVNDITSIERTEKSNHTLTLLRLPCLSYQNDTKEIRGMKLLIDGAVSINKKHEEEPDDAAREKIIESQLNTIRRREMCIFQGVEFDSNNLLEGIDGIYAPDVLALATEIRDSAFNNILFSLADTKRRRKIPLTEFYRMLKILAPSLTSLINRKGLLEYAIEGNRAQMAVLAAEYEQQTKEYSLQTARFVSQTGALTAENYALNKRLLSMGYGKAPAEESSARVRETKKRRRSASF